MSKLMIAIFCSVRVGASLVAPNHAGAQEIPKAETPTVEECDTAVAALESGADRKALRWGILPECGPASVDAMADALAAAGSEPGDHYLRSLMTRSRSVQAESILNAAEGLARDHGATRAARVAGLLILLGQYEPAVYPPINIPWEGLVSTPLTPCRLWPITDSGYDAQYPMPADYIDRIRAVMHDLAHDADPVVQAMASCMAYYVGPFEQP
ncbi:MAG: hypothetical protein ACREK5_00100 [Gemmatimonadota bacterium]